jgi:hypothetical protein
MADAGAITKFAEWLEELDGYVRAGKAHPNVKETVNSMEKIVHSCLDEQLAGISSLCFPTGAGEGSVQDGVPGVLHRSLSQSEQVNQLHVDLRSELLRFLEIFLQDHVLERSRPADAAAHALPVARACYFVFRRDSSAKVRELCFHPLTYCCDLKELCPDRHELSEFVFGEMGHDPVRNPSLTDAFWNEHSKPPSKSTPPVRGGCLKLLGQVARCFPVEASNCTHFSNGKVYERCMKTLADELDPAAKAPKLPEVAGALAGLDGLMPDAELSPSEVEHIFGYVLQCLNYNVEEQKRYTVPREALMLLGNNLPAFAAELPARGVDGPRLADSLLLSRGSSLWAPLHTLSQHPNQYLRPLAYGVLREVVHCLAAQIELAAADGALRDLAVRAHNALMTSLGAQTSGAQASTRVGSMLRVRCELAPSVKALQGADAVTGQLAELCRFARGHFAPHAVRHSDQSRAEMESRLSELPAFLEAFSILLPNVPAGLGGSAQRSSLVELLHDLLMLLHSYFVRLTPKQRMHAAGATQQLLAALTAEPEALEDLLTRTTFPMLVLIVDATASLAAGPASLRVAFATDLWSPLLDPDTPPSARFEGQTRRRGHTKYARSEARRGGSGGDSEATRQACSKLLEHVLRALTRMLQSFNLAMKEAGDAEEPAAAEGAGPEGGGAADPEYDTGGGGLLRPMGLSAAAEVANRGDLFLFLGTVRFCEALLPEVRPDLFVQWVHLLLLELVALASRSPHISGFVKLLRAVLVVCARCDYFETAAAAAEHSRERCYAMLRAFLLALLCRARRLKDELFASAAGLLLSSPRRFVGEQLAMREAPLILLLRHALSLGHAYKPLAHLSVAALEDWTDHLASLLQQHMPIVLPALRDYLTVAADAQDGLGGAGPAGDKVGRRGLARTHTRRITRARAARGEEELLQARVVRLLGRAGGDVVILVDADSAAPAGGEVRWELVPRVELRAPLAGERDLHLHLDDVLPRVLDLATSSLAYREKAAACELLEASVKLAVGLNRADAADFSSVNAKLYPAVLRLATDADGFVRGLFEPLALQLIHWITRPARSSSAGPTRDSLLMLETLMAAMSDGSHPGLREFGARCLAEFVRYALKHKANTSIQSPHAVRALLQRLCSLARNPDPLKRLSFAFALNSCYRELREDADTLDEALLELLYNSLLALRLSDADPPALGTADALCEVIDRLERMLKQTAAPLREPNPRRAIFVPGLGGADGFVVWLLNQTTQRQARARLRCCQLFETAAAVAMPDGRHSTGASARWVQAALSSGELQSLPAAACFELDAKRSWRCLGDGAPADAHALPGWLADVQAALDCSFWTVTQKHAPLSALLDTKGALHPAFGCLNVLMRESAAGASLAGRLAEAGRDAAGQEGGWAGVEAVAEPTAPLCDALRSALRLLKYLLRLAANLATGASPLAAVDAPAARAAARAALLTPADVGCELGSAAPRTFRMRELAAEVLALAHKHDPTAAEGELRKALAELTPPLLTAQLGQLGMATQDTLGLHAMVDGMQRLYAHAPAALQAALPKGGPEFALSLAQLAHTAPASTRPLELALLSACLDLSLSLGLDSRSLIRLACDAEHGPAFSRRFGSRISEQLAAACGKDAEGVLGALVGGGGAGDWAEHGAAGAGSGPSDLLSAPGFCLLLKVLECLELSPHLAAEPAVAAARRRLDALMAPGVWPAPARVGGVLRLTRLLVSLSPATVLRSSPGAQSEVLTGLLKLLKPARGFSPDQATSARTQLLKLLPCLLRALRPSALAAEKSCLLAAIQEMLDDELPLRFSELQAARREEVSLLRVLTSEKVRQRLLPLRKPAWAFPIHLTPPTDGRTFLCQCEPTRRHPAPLTRSCFLPRPLGSSLSPPHPHSLADYHTTSRPSEPHPQLQFLETRRWHHTETPSALTGFSPGHKAHLLRVNPRLHQLCAGAPPPCQPHAPAPLPCAPRLRPCGCPCLTPSPTPRSAPPSSSSSFSAVHPSPNRHRKAAATPSPTPRARPRWQWCAPRRRLPPARGHRQPSCGALRLSLWRRSRLAGRRLRRGRCCTYGWRCR